MGEGGRNSDMTRGWIAVVAGALHGPDGRWLMQRRPEGKHHAGLWEFPGGKVEGSEMPAQSLCRELREELGINCRADALSPCGFAETGDAGTNPPIVILLYIVNDWEGDPQALEGGTVGWFTPAEALALPKPPLDIALAQRLFENIENSSKTPCQA